MKTMLMVVLAVLMASSAVAAERPHEHQWLLSVPLAAVSYDYYRQASEVNRLIRPGYATAYLIDRRDRKRMVGFACAFAAGFNLLYSFQRAPVAMTAQNGMVGLTVWF